MKTIIRNYGVHVNREERVQQKLAMRDMTIARGTAIVPGAPRNLIAQSGSRGVLISWKLPAGRNSDIVGFRIYKDTQTALIYETHDPKCNSHFIEANSGSTPPVTNFFISSINKLGVESPKTMVQGTASIEAGAPTIPSVPPNYNTGYSGGSGRQKSYQ